MPGASENLFEINLRLDGLGLVSMPYEILPRNIDWNRWFDCCSAASAVRQSSDSYMGFPVMLASDPNDIDLLKTRSIAKFGDNADLGLFELLARLPGASELQFCGPWMRESHSWLKGIGEIFETKFLRDVQWLVSRNMAYWSENFCPMVDHFSFLVADLQGRFHSLATLSEAWLRRHVQGGSMSENFNPSWFAAVMRVLPQADASISTLRIRQLAIIDAERLIDPSAAMHETGAGITNLIKSAPEVWLSFPRGSLGVATLDRFGVSISELPNVRMPGLVLGWHSIRDALIYAKTAPAGSIMLAMDRNFRVNVMLIDREKLTNGN